MKSKPKSKISILFATLLVAVVTAFLAPRQVSADVNFSYFYDSLQPYGDWVDVDHYGYCWMPRGMAPDWRPYTDGYWTYTDAGWTWVSYEDFGSITYHYGRWVRLEDVGWVWKPDYRWGPAWVSWRQSDRYMGWAPLPPDVDFDENTGVGVWVDRDYDIGPSAYVFCETRYFGAPVIRNVIVPIHRNVEILDLSVNITNITVIAGHDHGRMVFNGGPNYAWISQRSERPINRLELVMRPEGDWLAHGRVELTRNVGTQLIVNAPVIVAPHDRFVPPHVAREIRAPRIDKGWVGISDPGVRERIHQRYQEQTTGLTRQTAPAYSVNAGEVHNFVRQGRPTAGTQAPTGTLQAVQPTPAARPGMTAPAVQQPTAPGQRPQGMAKPSVQPSVQPSQAPQMSKPAAAPAAQPSAAAQRPSFESQRGMQRPQPQPTAQPQAQQPRERETARPQVEQSQRPSFESQRGMQRPQQQPAQPQVQQPRERETARPQAEQPQRPSFEGRGGQRQQQQPQAQQPERSRQEHSAPQGSATPKDRRHPDQPSQ